MKTIAVPLTKAAEKRLDYNECNTGDLLELELNDCDFEKIWNTDLFYKLNNALSIMIDEFEDEKILNEKNIDKAIVIIDEIIAENTNINSLVHIKKLFATAKECKSGVYFYF